MAIVENRPPELDIPSSPFSFSVLAKPLAWHNAPERVKQSIRTNFASFFIAYINFRLAMAKVVW
jgi:hypothetical protein